MASAFAFLQTEADVNAKAFAIIVLLV